MYISFLHKFFKEGIPKYHIFLKFQIFSLSYNHIDWLGKEPMSFLFSHFFKFFFVSLFIKKSTAMLQILYLTFFYHTFQSYLSVCLWNITLTVRKTVFSFCWHIFHFLYKERKFGNNLRGFLLPNTLLILQEECYGPSFNKSCRTWPLRGINKNNCQLYTKLFSHVNMVYIVLF